MKKLVLSISVLVFGIFSAQENTEVVPPKLTFSGNLELFYSYDFNQPGNHIRQPFLYTYNRHNEVNLNLGLVKANYSSENIRANLALMAGTYVQDNLAAEQNSLKYVNEANIGFKISKNKNLWIDAGILPSHIGWESAVGKDNLTLTRSLAAENSPYFETGAKISYTSDNGKFFLSGLVLNGWQRIARPEGNQTLAFGHQLTYKFSDNFSVNSSSFVGNDKPTEDKRMRYFHDLYANFNLGEKWSGIAGFDIGAEQKAKGSEQYSAWYSPNLLLSYAITDKDKIGGRVEYYNDKNGVIIRSATPNGFQTFGYSLNFDHQIQKNLSWRTEVRGFSAKDAIFTKDNLPQSTNFSITTSLSAWF
ncbi:porin [Halpernia frigidisoli]|uniref:Putative beta-barrel porin-2, OmpL-like. bbp2 n=1 Tax=Halpernia frigidisoli TaxID=1125876 RepID=A0A1I3HQJ6_9FLAO|nr:porin [Halpernia frigidisoli]SFI37800.1 Putative beta-barrel porin-2, OmpL-like. bbp2 [Halpernia frigidisoli]